MRCEEIHAHLADHLAGTLPPDGFGAFLVALRGKGFTAQEVDRMAKQNPARLLGLP